MSERSTKIKSDIWEEIGDTSSPATEQTLELVAKDATIADLQSQLALVLDRLEFGNITDKSKTLLVQLDPKLSSTAAVATVTTLTNQARAGDIQMQRFYEAQADGAFNSGIINNISF